MSKALVNGMTATLARENSGMTINCCCPGWVDTDMGQVMGQPPKSLGKSLSSRVIDLYRRELTFSQKMERRFRFVWLSETSEA